MLSSMSSRAQSQVVPPTTSSEPSASPSRASSLLNWIGSRERGIVGCALTDGDPGAPLIRDPRHLREQLADDLVAVRGDADAVPGSHEVDDHLRPDRALARPGRPLDREVALVHLRDQAAGRALRVLALAAEVLPLCLSDSRRPAREQIPRRAVRAGAVKTVFEHPAGEPLQVLRLRLRPDEVVRYEGGGRRRRLGAAAPEVDQALFIVDEHDRARGRAGLGIVRCVVDPDGVVLGREAEPVDGRPRPWPRVRPGALERQLADRVGLLAALLVGELAHEIEVPPPERLRLAPVPVQELRQQPAASLGALEIVSALGQSGAEGGRQFVHRLLLLAVLPLLRLGDGGPGEVAVVEEKLHTLLFEPIPEAQRRHAVVAVVLPDPREQVVPLAALPELEPGLELNDARARIAQVHLAGEPIERLQALDRVALDRRADALPDGPVEIDEDPAAQQLVDLLLAGAVAPRETLHCGRLVGRVVVDVQVRVRFEPVADEVDERLEGAPLGAGGDGAFLDRPEGVERWLPVGVRADRLDDAEEVVDAVDLLGAEERVALDIEEEVARRRLGQHEQSLVGNQLLLAISRQFGAL